MMDWMDKIIAKMVLVAIFVGTVGVLWMSAILVFGCAAGNLSPEITAEADIRAEVAVDASSSSSTTTGNNSTVLNLQIAGGGGALLIGLGLGAWLGRRTPLKALGRTIQAIEQQDATKNVRRVVASLGRCGSKSYFDRAGRMIHRIVKKQGSKK